MSMIHIRYRNALLVLGILCAGASALPARGASFDCAKAGTKVEHMICDSLELSNLDDEMADKFKSAQMGADDRAKVVRGQRQWPSTRNACLDVACVKDAYERRLSELSVAPKGAEVTQPASGPTQAVASNTAKPENALSERDRVRQIMASHRFSLSLVRDKSEESFCKTFVDDFRAMKGITFLEPEIESESYADKRWDAYKADLFEGFSCTPKAQEYVDSLPEEDRRAEEMNSCQQFRCTQTFRLFKVAGKGYAGPAFNAFYCEHSRGPLNLGNTDQDMGAGYQFIELHHCSSSAYVPTANTYSYGAQNPLGSHNAIILYKGGYFVFDLVNRPEGDANIRASMREYTLTLWGGLNLSQIKLPELELPTITPICSFSTTSQSKNK
jgi:uncharacterized protein